MECYLERTADEILGVLAEASKENPRTDVDMFAGDILNLKSFFAKLSFFSFNRVKIGSEKAVEYKPQLNGPFLCIHPLEHLPPPPPSTVK